MSVLVAVLVVGAGSLLFRLVPLLGAHRVPDRVAEVAEHAGIALLSAMTVRGVLLHADAGVPAAPLLAALATAVGLVLAYAGRSALVAVAAGAATYLVLTAVLAATP